MRSLIVQTKNNSVLYSAMLIPGDCITREDPVTFIECDSGITGQALADKIIGVLLTSCLDPTKMCGQAYDWAVNMTGKANGAAVLILAQYPLTLYIHCAFHCLNLSVVNSLLKPSIYNIIGVVNRVSIFFPLLIKSDKGNLKRLLTVVSHSRQHKN